MNTSRLIFLTLLLGIVLGCFKIKRDQLFTPQTFNPETDIIKEITQEDGEAEKEVHQTEMQLGPMKSQDQQKNLESMVEVLMLYSKEEAKLSTLLSYLTQSEQAPFVVQDSNIWTDGMILVRTQKPFLGTRYFHAQYFYGESVDPFLQHMSFEFRPGSDSMRRAVEAISAHKDRVGDPYIVKDDFVAWRMKSPLQIYVKKMGCMDLEYHPYNAYTARDIGTIKVAVEIDPHMEEEEGVESGHDHEEDPSIPEESIEPESINEPTVCDLPTGS